LSPIPFLPPPLRGSDPASFAEHTLSVRLPNIARRTLSEIDWPAETAARLQSLADELPHGQLRLLQDLDAPDGTDWNRWLTPYLGQNWLEVPWFLAETCFFCRLLEATGYYRPGFGQGVDPYSFQKRQGLASVEQALQPLCTELEPLRFSRPSPESANFRPHRSLAGILRLAVWGNQADFSLWPAGSAQPGMPENGHLAAQLLVDHAEPANRYLEELNQPARRLDFILDNGGVELAYDLALADFLLANSVASAIHFHLKPYPIYVSDATVPDVYGMVAFLASSADLAMSRLARRLDGHLESGKLRLQTDLFWASPLSGWEMPPTLGRELGQSDLIVSKGDVNYRRWVGDRHWPFATPEGDVLDYLPAPVLFLRVFKSNVVVGLQLSQEEEVGLKDPQWLYNGNWGIIQFFCGPGQ
jgi:hypothetical protein